MTPAAGEPRRAAESLAAAIGAGLHALSDLNRPHPDVTSGALERALRAVVARPSTPPQTPAAGQPAADADRLDPLSSAAAAVRAACAHLSAGDLVDAYLALRTAFDALPRDHRGDAHDDDTHDEEATTRRGRTVADTHRRALSARAAIEQGAGVLAHRTGITAEQAAAALRRYAEHHRFVLAELAGDVVAGRVPPGLVADLADLADFADHHESDDGPTPGAHAR